jgi:hypothetical protein
MTDLTTRGKPRTDLPASRPPTDKPKTAERKPHKASTHGRDPFEVLGIDSDAEDRIPF